MDTIFTLPLFILAVLQALITALHVSPGVGLPLSQSLRALSRNTASRSVIYTFMVALALLSASSMYELSKGAEKVRSGNLRGEVMATVDYLRAQVSCALSLSNLLVMLLNLALSSERCKLDFTQKNLLAMQRQVKGLQAEYDRVTRIEKDGKDSKVGAAPDDKPSTIAAAAAASVAAAAAEEAAALKKTVDKLIAEKQQLQAVAEAAEAAAKTSEARVTAMVSQIKGFDKEFDRLLDENKALMAQLQQRAAHQQLQQQGGGAGAALGGKKDD